MYAASVLHCLPVGRADTPSAATGTVMRPATFTAYASGAGFSRGGHPADRTRPVPLLPPHHLKTRPSRARSDPRVDEPLRRRDATRRRARRRTPLHPQGVPGSAGRLSLAAASVAPSHGRLLAMKHDWRQTTPRRTASGLWGPTSRSTCRRHAHGKEPHVYSRTLRGDHQLLWSNPLPGGTSFELSDTTRGVYPHHRSRLWVIGRARGGEDRRWWRYTAWTTRSPSTSRWSCGWTPTTMASKLVRRLELGRQDPAAAEGCRRRRHLALQVWSSGGGSDVRGAHRW